MKPFQMILVFLRHLKYHLEDVSGFAIFSTAPPTTSSAVDARKVKERRSLALPDSAFHGVFLCFDLHYFIYCANIFYVKERR